jgi:iron complex transport system permease protein
LENGEAHKKLMSPWIVLRSKQVPVSLRIDRRVPLMAAFFIMITLAGMVINIGVGEYPISPWEVIQTLLGLNTGNPDHAFIVLTLRLPRMILAWMVGVALGVAGSIVQGITRNPLASPDLTGVTAGASLAAVTLIVVFPKAPSGLLPLVAFGGGMAVAGLLYVLAWRSNGGQGGDSPMRLILVGIGLSAALGALISFMITFGEITLVEKAMMWLAGSVYASDWGDVWAMAPWLVVCLPLALLGARDLNMLNLGEDLARGLGLRVVLQRGLLLLIAVALCGAVVVAAGAIGFVGLLAPHITRKLVGPMHEGSLPLSGLIGGVVVVLSDLVGRVVAAPAEIPVGIVVALVGAPFFIYLLWQHRERF